jgi:hypothetical protein
MPNIAGKAGGKLLSFKSFKERPIKGAFNQGLAATGPAKAMKRSRTGWQSPTATSSR